MQDIKLEPNCSFFGSCGGCQYQDIPYEAELKIKEAELRKLLAESVSSCAQLLKPVIASPKIYHYRNRLDLKLLKRKNGQIHIGFSPEKRAPVLEISSCPIASEAISQFIPTLRQEAARKLPPDYRIANLTVRCGEGPEVHWGGIGKGSLRLNADDYFYTELNGKRIFYSLDTFFQANLSILPVLSNFLPSLRIWDKEADFFDLYGGVGLFGLMVHDLVAKVINIELNIHATSIASRNVEYNRLSNVEVLSGSVEEILPGLLTAAATSKNIMMVDPPRAGLSDDAIELLNGLKRTKYLLYLSCNPQTLALNLKGLTESRWQVELIQPFDFFPRTRHLETLVLLSAR